MRKYTKSESIELIDDKKTEVIKQHLSKIGKTKVSELDEEELELLRDELTDDSEQ